MKSRCYQSLVSKVFFAYKGSRVLCHGPLPISLHSGASLLVVVGVVAGRAKGHRCNKSAIDGAVELGPHFIGRPAVIAG